MSDTITLPEEKTEEKTKRQPPYHVILLNDDDHSYQYVIYMLQKLFGHPPETGFKMAQEVDKTGRVVVDTTSRERAERAAKRPAQDVHEQHRHEVRLDSSGKLHDGQSEGGKRKARQRNPAQGHADKRFLHRSEERRVGKE